MAPVARESPPSSIINSSRAPAAAARTPSREDSLSSSLEEDVFEGLVESVNDAIRHQQVRQTQDCTEQQIHQSGAPTSYLLKGANPRKLEEDSVHVNDQVSGLSLAILNSMNGRLRQNTHNVLVLAGATPNEENRVETNMELRVDNILQPIANVWDVPNSPRQPSVQGEPSGSSRQMLPYAKKRGRPPKVPKSSGISGLVPDGTLCTEKKKVGRPRKHYPRLCNEAGSDYTARIARLRKKRIPCVLESDAYLSSQLPSVSNATGPAQSIATNQSEHINQDDGAHIESLRHTRFHPDNPQHSPIPDIQPKVEQEEDLAQPINHTDPNVGGPDCDEQNGGPGRNDSVARYESIAPNGNECSDSDATEDDGNLSSPIDGLDTDLEIHSVLGQPSEESFEHDANVFNARKTRDIGDEVFEGPVDDDVLATHLDHQPLRQLCKLLGDASWAGVRGNWQWRHFDYDNAETKSAEALLQALAKLERLYQASPKAPNLREQNQFLRDHADMLRYYFHKITTVIDHIRIRRLEIPKHGGASHDAGSRKRKRMIRDLVLYVMPMLAHVLASAWGLGGKTWLKTSFTSTTVELLKRALGWIMVLYPRLLGGLKQFPLEEQPENQRQQQAWQKRNIRREGAGLIIDSLCQVITAAPDQLAEAEERAKKELQQREQQLRREKQLEIEQKLEEEARQALVAERKKRSLLSIHGIHYRLGSSTTSSRPSPSLSLRSAEWSAEEQRILFLRIQASFPVCPDLHNLRWELNKTVAQMVAMTEEILGKMLAKVLVGYSPEERTAQLREIMRSSGVAGL
ncbi:hypothetical protein O1611_g8019 [Lasiodiplodia mahajangana]|uniref:Uncharacterized protein n=1 Tax=Lasiodiplodia mahajangana TaxID=1108764 RepID=A0ACC2JEJ4_9PEZI|nr:hypothetical protein O1611_g8019 [Lasiodiplodia mahajangana]